MKNRTWAAAVAVATIALTSACSSSDTIIDKEPVSSAAASGSGSAGQSGDQSAEASDGEDTASPTSAVPTDANGREILPDAEPAGWSTNDASTPFAFGTIVSYVNKYPGWIELTTNEPTYDAASGGYRINVYFDAEAGSDIILRDEFSLIVDGQTYKPEPLEPVGSGGTTDWLSAKTSIGNRPDSTQNYQFGDILFKIPQTQSPLEMHYDNVDGDVHITWRPDGKQF